MQASRLVLNLGSYLDGSPTITGTRMTHERAITSGGMETLQFATNETNGGQSTTAGHTQSISSLPTESIVIGTNTSDGHSHV